MVVEEVKGVQYSKARMETLNEDEKRDRISNAEDNVRSR